MAKTLVTSDLKFNRVDAHRYAKENGKTLASYRLLDEGIMSRKVGRVSCAREFLAYPASGEVFYRKEDIVDPKTKSRIPLEFVRDLDIYRPGIGLVVDPKDLDVHKKTRGIVLLPASIVVLDNFIQKGDEWVEGNPDENTRVPLAVSIELWESLSKDEQRWLARASKQGVRPLVRLCGSFGHYNVRNVGAYDLPHDVRGVAFEEDIPDAKPL